MSMSEITVHKSGGVTYAGPDAVELFRVATLKSALGLLKVGITPTRGLTTKRALAMATPYTGQIYKHSQIDVAIRDLGVWIETMKSAIPVTRRDA